MKKLLAILLFTAVAASAQRSTTVRPHTTKNGTYVPQHHRTTPNKTQTDNYSSKGNVNPYTGKAGTKTPKR